MLIVDNLHAGYGRIPVLSGISFTVAEHEVVGVLGHNGMGKTTLLKTLIGQVPLTRGRFVSMTSRSGTCPRFAGPAPAWATFRKAAPSFRI